MKLVNNILTSICAATGALAGSYEPKFRISPLDGSKIALPTKEQLAFQDKEIGVLIHYEIATYLDIDGCNEVPDLVPDISLFKPSSINTDGWMDSAVALGAKYATLVAKHNCGFAIWPSEVTFQNRENQTVPYDYTIAQSPVHGQNVVKSFVESAQKYNIGHGFYYSVVVNNYLNVQDSDVRAGHWAPGQVNITNGTYDQIVYDQLSELWKGHGRLTEVFVTHWREEVFIANYIAISTIKIWFDGGYSSSQKDKIENLLQETQPQAVIFNGCDTDGTCLSGNPSKFHSRSNPLGWNGTLNIHSSSMDRNGTRGSSGGELV